MTVPESFSFKDNPNLIDKQNYIDMDIMSSKHVSVYYERRIKLFSVTRTRGFFVILLISIINIPFQIWNAIEAYGDVDRFMNNFGPTLVMMNFAIKLVAFKLSQRAVKFLVKEILDDFEKSNNDVMTKNIKTTKLLYRLIAVSYNTLIIWCIIISIKSYNKTKSVQSAEFLLPVTYPFITKNWENYTLVNVFSFFQMIIAANGHAIIEGSLALTVLHAATQVHNIRSAIKQYCQMCCTTTDQAKINQALRNLVTIHYKYFKFAANVERAFTYIAFSQLSIVSLQMCAVEYALIKTIEKNVMTTEGYMYLNLLVADLCGAATYCVAGEYFIIQSDYIYGDLCQCPWYKFRVNNMKTLLILLPKLQRPPVITCGKLRSLSLFCLMSILKTSFSYLSVLRAIKTRQQ